MAEINSIKDLLCAGSPPPAGVDTKRFNKLIKRYKSLPDPKFAALYAMYATMI